MRVEEVGVERVKERLETLKRKKAEMEGRSMMSAEQMLEERMEKAKEVEEKEKLDRNLKKKKRRAAKYKDEKAVDEDEMNQVMGFSSFGKSS